MENSEEVAKRKAGETLRAHEEFSEADEREITIVELQRAILDANARKAVSPTGVNYHM